MKKFKRQILDTPDFKAVVSYDEYSDKMNYLSIIVTSKKKLTDEVISVISNFVKELFSGR